MTDKEKQLAAAVQAIEAAKLSEIANDRTLSAHLIGCLVAAGREAVEERRYEIHVLDAGSEAAFLDAVAPRDAAMWERKRWADRVLKYFPEGVSQREQPIKGPYGCKCKTLAVHVLGDGCDECNQEHLEE